jgi:2-aminoadipate transaminase
LLLNPGGQVLIEEMTYTGFQQVLQPYQPEILTVPTDLRTGMDVEAVEALLESGARPSLIYCVTDGHNPLAVSLSRAKRERLVQLACEYRVPVIEDDPYGFLHYENAPLPPLRALDDQWVYYVGTFSKMLAPALRAGWMIVPEEFIPYLSTIKEASDINMSPLSQRAIAAYLDAGHLTAHLARLRQEYKIRRDAMSDSLQEHLSLEARWQRPANGMFIWVELPETVDAGELFKAAIKRERVAFIPGQAFSVGSVPRASNCMRLNFSNNSAALIEEGIARLARVLKSEMA